MVKCKGNRHLYSRGPRSVGLIANYIRPTKPKTNVKIGKITYVSRTVKIKRKGTIITTWKKHTITVKI